MSDQLDKLYSFSARLPYLQLHLHVQVYQVFVLTRLRLSLFTPSGAEATDQTSPSSSVLCTSFHLSPVHPVVHFLYSFLLHVFLGSPSGAETVLEYMFHPLRSAWPSLANS